ncbi:FUSC family membrane protein [Ferruginibacter yonginensis]|uniref:FUSC family membrane protein n=1 Tax=Ferruginibacter yonginensis TaxID=1310416 RepID=A0ABV8QNY2_9BACT
MISLKAYTNFINGRYFSEGIRMTVGIALPAFLLGYFDQLPIGIIISTGALCISVTDSVGPVRHRLNGMLYCNAVVVATAIITYWALQHQITTGILISVFGFIFSMLAIYNARVSSIGLSALLIMVLCMQNPLKGAAIYEHAMYLLVGGVWYLVFSLLLHTLKPYKIIQQLSGEFITGVAAYLKTRASFYNDHPDYEATYKSLLQQQVAIQTQQATLNEILFKTRAITQNSTKAGRSLLKIYIDVADLFESIMSTYQQYEVLHQRFDETGILDAYREQLIYLADELHEIGLAIGAGNASVQTDQNTQNLILIKEKFEALRQNFMTANNLNDFIGLGRIFNNIKGLTEKISSLHYYTRYEKSQRNEPAIGLDLQKFNEAQNIDPTLFLNNLNLKSNIFRHSLRVAFSLLLGYIISLFFNIGHSYWILLTIIVILKPAYSLTKTRNKDRLIGTIVGLVLGVAILFLIKNNMALMAIMIVLMAGCYMFLRTNYFLSVLLMTPYLVIFFHLIYPANITVLLTDRLIDTTIGSAIVFISSLFFVPVWEHTTIKHYMELSLQKNIDYFTLLASQFVAENEVPKETLKKARQYALTALANVSDAFNRMLSEPKRYQKNTEYIYRFVVLNHILTSHFSALAFYISEQKNSFKSDAFLPVIDKTNNQLQQAISLLHEIPYHPLPPDNSVVSFLKQEMNDIIEKRKVEIATGQLETATKKQFIDTKSIVDQFTYIYNISSDILKNVISYTEESSTLPPVNTH